MNNRYTFKGKTKQGKWVYGLLIRKRDLTFNNEYKEYCAIQDDFFEEYEILPETLCQCTGLQDRDGNYIFENDNVKYCEVCIEEPTEEELKNLCINEWEYGTVIFGIEQGYPAFDLDKHDFDSNAFSYMIATGYTIKIIGNKFDKEVE